MAKVIIISDANGPLRDNEPGIVNASMHLPGIDEKKRRPICSRLPRRRRKVPVVYAFCGNLIYVHRWMWRLKDAGVARRRGRDSFRPVRNSLQRAGNLDPDFFSQRKCCVINLLISAKICVSSFLPIEYIQTI